MFVAFYMLPQRVRFDQPFDHNWMLISDYYFFVLYSMVVMGFVMVFEWDALFPDRKDYLILTPLPLGGSSIFSRRSAPLALFLGLFVLDANLFWTLLAPLVTAPARHARRPCVCNWSAAHAAAVLVGGTLRRAGVRGRAGRADQRADRARVPPRLAVGADGARWAC